MSFRDVFQTEWIEKVRGEEIVFPLLLIEDYVPWTTELHDVRKKSDLKAIALEKNTVERIRLQRASDQDVPDFYYLRQIVPTVPGSKRVLSMSLKKTGRSEEEIGQVLSRIRPGRLNDLACTVSALYDIARDLPEPEKKNPNAGTSDPEGESNQTGNSSGSSSDTTAA